MTSVAVIDSGIDINFKEFKNQNIKSLNINTYETNIDSIKDFNGHGTACAAEIFRINPSVDINIIKVLNENSQSSVKALIKSIEYASDIEDVRLISLSCSTFKDKYLDDFKKIIEYANRKNKLLICSSDNSNKCSYPSYMDGVIGVQRCNAKINRYWFNKNLNIQCVCEANHRLLPSKDGKYKLFGGNSYSTAYFCGLVSKLLKENNQIENKQIIDIIAKNSDKEIWCKKDMYRKENLKEDYRNKKYDYHKLKILKDIITKFSKEKNKYEEYVEELPIYNIVGLDNVYELIKNIEKEVNKNIIYNEVTYKDLLSIYSLYNLVFKDEKNEK